MLHRLKQIDWKTDPVQAMTTLRTDITRENLENAQDSISTYVRDEAARSLLYRLSLIHWSMDSALIEQISTIEVQIENHFEKLQQLVDVWIQNDGTAYYVSPLIQDLGLRNLSSAQRRSTYLIAADSILKTRKLDQITGARTINLFIKAREFDSAGSILGLMYRYADTKDQAKWLEEWGYLGYWSEEAMPPQMSLSNRAMLQSEKIRIYNLLGKNSDDLKLELRSYLSESGKDEKENAFVSLMAIGALEPSNVELFLANLVVIFKHWEQVKDLFTNDTQPNLFAELIWIPASFISTLT
ncbi:MAG: hypothetical protein EOP48_34740, partial [Sphingobacteriales bacterium]